MIDNRLAALATIRSYLEEGAEVRHKLAAHCAEHILNAAELLATRMKQGGAALICGNGGSAADSQHMAAEFTSRLTKDFVRPGLPAIALTTDTSFLTAYANDCGFAGIFERQVEAIGKASDVLIGISTSGASENVLKAVAAARTKGMAVITLCGEKGPLSECADVAVCVPSGKTQFVQECHLAVEHLICHLVERAIFPPR